VADKETITILLPKELVQKTDEFSSEHGITTTQIIEQAIEQKEKYRRTEG
jgi:predicted transcriptional regulator